MITIATAPTKARKLVKSAGFTRRTLSDISKSEQVGTDGATEAREKLTANFARNLDAANKAIGATEAAADDLDALSLDLRTPDTPRHPKARALRLLGHSAPRCAGLADLAGHVGARMRDAASKAQDRLDENDDNLQATALHALLLSRLPSVKFDIKHPSLKSLRSEYQSRVEASKKARNS